MRHSTHSPRSRHPVKLWPILILAGLTGCATSTPVSDYCLMASPIFYSMADTPETVAQIERHNSDYECACNEDCE